MGKRDKTALSMDDLPHYDRFQALYLSFYSSKLYVDVIKRWRGLGLVYLLLLIACATIPFSVRFAVKLNTYLNEHIVHPIQVLPPLFIHQGKVTFNKPMPYFIKNTAKEVVGLVDTSGKVTGVNSAYYPMLTWVLTKDKVYFRAPPFQLFKNASPKYHAEVSSTSIDPGLNTVFVGREWLQLAHFSWVKNTGLALLYPCFIFFLFSLLLTMLFALAWLGQFFARVMFAYMIDYRSSFRLLVVALTPAMMLCFGLFAAGFVISGIGIVYVALLAAYYSFGIVVLKRNNRSMVYA